MAYQTRVARASSRVRPRSHVSISAPLERRRYSGGESPQDVLDAVRREIAVTPRAPYDRFMHSFSHIFAGGYASSYYAYLWSEVLARDTGEWFHSHGGLSRANGNILRAKVLSRGRSEDPEKLFRDFYGHAPDVKPLLEYRGLSQH